MENSILLQLKELCHSNRKLVRKLVISGEDYEQLRWEVHEQARQYGYIGRELPMMNPGVKIYGVEIDHD